MSSIQQARFLLCYILYSRKNLDHYLFKILYSPLHAIVSPGGIHTPRTLHFFVVCLGMLVGRYPSLQVYSTLSLNPYTLPATAVEFASGTIGGVSHVTSVIGIAFAKKYPEMCL